MRQQEDQLDRIAVEAEASKVSLSRSKRLMRKISWTMFGWTQRERRPSRSSSLPHGDSRGIGAAGHQEEDDFAKEKRKIKELLGEATHSINEYQRLVEKGGSTGKAKFAEIEVRRRFDVLEQSVPRLQEALRRSRAAESDAVMRVETQSRYQDVREINRQIKERRREFLQAVDLAQNISGGNKSRGTPTPLGRRTPHFGSGNSYCLHEEDVIMSSRSPTSEEQEVLKEIRNRDAKLDGQIHDVGTTVDRLTELAGMIGTATQRQKSKADAVIRVVDENHTEITNMNKRIKKQLRKP
jgi:hypothetical protein